MEIRQLDQTSNDFEFINITGGSGRERRRNNYLARAHAAKINRQNFKSQTDSRRSKNAQNFSILPKTLTSDLAAKESSNEDETGSEDDAVQGSNRATETPGCPEQLLTDAVETVPTPRSIAHAYGAIPFDTFDWNSQPISAQVGHYCEFCRVMVFIDLHLTRGGQC